MVPHLAREAEKADAAKLSAIDVIFQSFNRYLGVAVGEHLGYMFTGLWTFSFGGAILSSIPQGSPGWHVAFGISGAVLGLLLLICSMEFVGQNEPEGWAFAGKITPFVYILWSLWLMFLGLSIIFAPVMGLDISSGS
jgi:hypothetical protein